MFRFIALAWDRQVPACATAAAGLVASLRHQEGWQCALSRSGLHVAVTGTRPGNNEASLLHGGQGVVLGRLFLRAQPGDAPAGAIALDAAASEEILRSCGRTLIERCWGRYVALLDLGAQGARVLRDPGGALPCHLLRHEGVDIVFSWLEDVLTTFPQVPHPRVDWDALAAHLAYGELVGRETALQGITQILPGEAVTLGSTETRGELLWNPAEQARGPTDVDPEEAGRSLRSTVRACVQAWASCHDSVLLRLSGGVDSSIVLSCLAHGQTRARITCVNYHSPGANSDEREYARVATRQARRDLVERSRDPDIRLENVLDVARTPTPPPYVGRLSSHIDAELARDVGATALFTGGGGDQLFFELHEWWPAADYLRLRGWDRGLARAVLDASRLGRVSAWRALRLAITDRLRTRTPQLDICSHWTLVTDHVRAQAGRGGHLGHPCMAAASELPVGKLMQVQQLLYPAGYYDPGGRDNAPELVNPLLSQPIVEQCLALPTWVLALGGEGRGLVRRAFATDLAPETANRRSKGGLGEHLRLVLQRNLDFVRELLLDGELVGQGLLDRSALEAALAGSMKATARTGEVHRYVAIEAWLRQWRTTWPAGPR